MKLRHGAEDAAPAPRPSPTHLGDLVALARLRHLGRRARPRVHDRHLTREYSTDPLAIFFAREVMIAEPVALRAADPLADAIARHTGPIRLLGQDPVLYPVLDGGGALAGILSHRDLLAAAAHDQDGRTVGHLAQPPRTVIHADQTLREVANAFAVHGTTCAPVVDAAEPGRLLGMVDLSQLLHARRQDQYEEHHRQRHLPHRLRRTDPVPDGALSVPRTTVSEGA